MCIRDSPNIAAVAEGNGAASEALEIINKDPINGNLGEEKIKLDDLQGQIELERVTFRYNE